MKKKKHPQTFSAILAIWACCIMLYGCGSHKVIRSKIIETAIQPESLRGMAVFTRSEVKYTDDQKREFYDLLQQQEMCSASNTHPCALAAGSTTTNCASSFCNSNPCKVKIKCCHKILETQFNEMTAVKTCGHAIFSRTEVLSVLNATDCNTELIKVTRWYEDGEYWYQIEDVSYADTAVQDNTWKAYYSVPMIKSLLETHNNVEIHIYKGGVVPPNKHLLPILLHFPGTTKPDEYYNLSNDVP